MGINHRGDILQSLMVDFLWELSWEQLWVLYWESKNDTKQGILVGHNLMTNYQVFSFVSELTDD